MLIQYGQALGDYLYDVFVAKFDFWLAFGLVAQLFFTARFLAVSYTHLTLPTIYSV